MTEMLGYGGGLGNKEVKRKIHNLSNDVWYESRKTNPDTS